MFTTEEEQEIMIDFYHNNMELEDICIKYKREKGNQVIQEKIIDVIKKFKKETIIEPFVKIPPLGSKKESYFEDEMDYGTLPIHPISELKKENPTYNGESFLDLVSYGV